MSKTMPGASSPGRHQAGCREPSCRFLFHQREDAVPAQPESVNGLFRIRVATHRDDEVDVPRESRLGPSRDRETTYQSPPKA